MPTDDPAMRDLLRAAAQAGRNGARWWPDWIATNSQLQALARRLATKTGLEVSVTRRAVLGELRAEFDANTPSEARR